MSPQHATNSAGREIIISRMFNAPRELVWRAWTEPELIARWWGPRDFNTRVEKLELRAGGQWRYVMVAPDGHEYPVEGTFSEVSPMNHFVTTSEFGKDFIAPAGMRLPKGTMLMVTFEDFGMNTRVTLRIIHRSADDRRKHEDLGVALGWKSSFECLDELLPEIG